MFCKASKRPEKHLIKDEPIRGSTDRFFQSYVLPYKPVYREDADRVTEEKKALQLYKRAQALHLMTDQDRLSEKSVYAKVSVILYNEIVDWLISCQNRCSRVENFSTEITLGTV